ncbi:head-tail joining protein [Burkholderia stagnalis]|uniref:head-tail joining protein n=1 Tax=Burkholderia stagnalis TaxID=1503054 RepID=UPI000F565C89|nr:hypothetical protein [Burkholderia stagnalis]RQQ37068.1 hypothetical protein DF163_01480 [Burkholderia stagnalis]RQQ55645.1 hypothetical protein DF162_01715 [Burkholderia stagnalis]RQY19106.1 hypothetical protein DF118_01720 [Burkholderia stagnalis]RQY64209.1 hypothetical protein DF112_00490 [Burkholderia stagnalis]RQY70396.1 hypothetical protein DF109_02310 [Burkholderia stagnalis]
MPSHPSWDDLDEFLESDEFASLATISLKNGAVLRDVVGVFDEPGMSAGLGTFEQDTTHPTFLCKWSAVSAVRRGDLFVIPDDAGVLKNYEAHKTPMRTGDGMAVVHLGPSL